MKKLAALLIALVIAFSVSAPAEATRAMPARSFAHLEPYYFNNSIRGLDYAVARGYRWIDLDANVSKDGTVWNEHWARISVDGYSARGVSRNATVGSLTDKQMERLAGPHRFHPHRMTTMFRAAARRHINIEMEAKGGRRFERPKTYVKLRTLSRELGVRVQVKTLTSIGGCRAALRRLRAASKAGFHTILLNHYHAAVVIPERFARYVDYVRGPFRIS